MWWEGPGDFWEGSVNMKDKGGSKIEKNYDVVFYEWRLWQMSISSLFLYNLVLGSKYLSKIFTYNLHLISTSHFKVEVEIFAKQKSHFKYSSEN